MSEYLNCLKILAGNKSFCLHPEVYVPSDDSLLLSHHSRALSCGSVLDMGTGCGIQAVLAAEKAEKVLAVDINEKALSLAKENAKLNQLGHKISFRQSNLFSSIKPEEKFDMIIFNPPYLPTTECEQTSGPLDLAWNGGSDGRMVIDRFLTKFQAYLNKGGSLLMLHCDLADTAKTASKLKSKGFSVEIIDELNVPGERLAVLLASK